MTNGGRFEGPAADIRSRYPGTAPFSDSPADRARFFGRERESDQLYLRVLSVPLLVQFGKSGLGKTSLLHAGLFPRLRDRSNTFLPVMVRLNEPAMSLMAAVVQSFEQSCESEGLDLSVGDTAGLWEFLATTTAWRDGLLLTPVLVFDQFEEVFTLRDATFRSELASELGALASGAPPPRLRIRKSNPQPDVKIVISLQEDYLAALEEFSDSIPGLFQERLRLDALQEDAAREAITKPALLVAAEGELPYRSPPFEFEPAALQKMIAFLRGSSDVIEPLQMQLLCGHAERIAWDRRDKRVNGIVTLSSGDFAETLHFEAVLKKFYHDTLAAVFPPTQRTKAARLCEEGLLGASGHRLLLEETQIRDDYGVVPATLATLAKERLIVRERRRESVFYEISHDRLAESIWIARRRKVPPRVRRLLWGTAIVMAVVLTGLVYWNVTIDAERRAVQKERDSAQTLLTFLLGEDFLGEVRDTGRSTMLGQVQSQVGNRGGTPHNRALALRADAEFRLLNGNLADAITLHRKALDIFARAGTDRDAIREVARSNERLALVLIEQRHFTEARQHFAHADAAWGRIAASGSATREDCLAHAAMLTSSSDLEYRIGEQTRSTSDLGKAMTIVFEVLFHGTALCAAPLGKPEPYPPSAAVSVLSQAALLRSDHYGRPEDAEAAVVFLREARKQNPSSVPMRHESVAAIANRGHTQEMLQKALDDYRTGLAEIEELRRWDPKNRQFQRERAVMAILVSETIALCNEAERSNACRPMPSLAAAEASVLEALASLRTIAHLDVTNLSVQGEISWGLQTLAKIHSVANRHAESLSRLLEAERMLRSSRTDKADSENVLQISDLLMDLSDAYAALKHDAEATSSLQQSRTMLENLVTTHPDNETYLFNLRKAWKSEAELMERRGDPVGAASAAAEAARLETRIKIKEQRRMDRALDIGERQREHFTRAGDLLREERFHEAVEELRASEAAAREYLSFEPTAHDWYDRVRNTYDLLASMYKDRDSAERVAALSAEMNAAQLAAWLAPPEGRDDADMNLLDARFDLSVELSTAKPDESLAMLQEVVVVAERLAEQSREVPDYALILGSAKCRVGWSRRKLDSPGWEEAIRSGLLEFERAVGFKQQQAIAFKHLGIWHAYLASEILVDRNPETAGAERLLATRFLQRALELNPQDAEVQQMIAAVEGSS